MNPAETTDVAFLKLFPHLTLARKSSCKWKALKIEEADYMHDISGNINNIHRKRNCCRTPLAGSKLVAKCSKLGHQNIHAYEDDTMYFVKGYNQYIRTKRTNSNEFVLFIEV